MLSKITYALCVGLMLYASFVFYPSWKAKGTEATIGWDVAGYYWYLPSIFIYKDLKHQGFADSVLKKYNNTGGSIPGFKYDNGNYVMKYSAGMALMYLPFFTAANILAKSLGYPRDGFSPPYQLGIQIGGLLIAFLGLWYFRKLFLLFYRDKVVSVLLLALVFGSNYLNYAAIGVGMSHSWLFTIYIFLLLNTYYFYRSPSYKYALSIGLLIGLATLIRPTEIISCLIPLLWGIERFTIAGFRQRASFLDEHRKKIALATLCAIMVFSIQLAYWKYVSGHWIVYSYGDQGFSWLTPRFLFYATNYQSGWLTYSPMLFFALIGIIPFIANGKNKVAILGFSLLNFYIISCWDISAIGGRAMIESYAALMFPMASLADMALERGILKWALPPFFVTFIYFNLWLTYNEHLAKGLYDPDSMTKKYFWRVVGRPSAPEETLKLLDQDDLFEGKPKNLNFVYYNNFENDSNKSCTLPPIGGNKSICVDKTHPYTPLYSVSRDSVHGTWIRAQAIFFCQTKEWNIWAMPQFLIRFTNKGEKVKETYIRISRLLSEHETKTLFFDSRIPDSAFDTVSVFFASTESNQTLEIDDLKIGSFNE